MMPRVDKTMLLAVLAGAAVAAVSASCANSCSGHGSCGTHDRCTCYAMWTGTDCSQKACPSGPSFTSDGYEVCSGRGVCDAQSGSCACAEGFTGYNCGRTSCPNDCSGHGKCTSAGVDGGMTRACVCDGYYSGADCSFRQCPRGDDPLTTEIECQGVSSGAQSHEVQEITLTADKQLSGEMTLTYTDAYGQAWTTMPIAVGGDLEYDLRMSGTGGCSLKYMSATLTSEKFRDSEATSADTDHDFAATEFSVPSVKAAAMNSDDCDGLSAAAMESILEMNGVVKNVKVTKSGDASTGTARFHVSIGDVNFQNENDGMEIGFFSMTGRTDAKFHSVGDRSLAIKDALQALPYNVVPSVDVSRVKVDGGSDYADSSVVYGNMVQQKYRITFSDAANAGDQVSLQCNAEGCDADGCAPRYKGVTHKRYISTKYGSDPMDPTGGVTDYRTAIVATGQGSWWLRSHSLDVRTKSTFTSGTYFVHWGVGDGEVSSASFAYDADEATIQTALRTIKGWGGVSVSCYGTPGFAGRDYTGVAVSNFGLECKVTYAKGFEDGGKLPTMTYANIHQGMDAANLAGVDTHRTNLGLQSDISFKCVNEMCIIHNIGWVNGNAAAPNDGDYTSMALFRGAVGTRTYSDTDELIAKQDNWIGYVYIRHEESAGEFPLEGTYEIVRVGSSSQLNVEGLSDLIIYAPGVADIASKGDAFDDASNDKNVWLYKATPLMPMWPSFSNSIALHDTSFRLIYAPEKSSTERLHSDTLAGQDSWSALKTANIHYGPFNTVASASASTGLGMTANTRCEGDSGLLKMLNDLAVSGPYPSLASSDGFSICDCKRTTMEVEPFEIEYTITCPGWLGYLINNDAVRKGANANLLETQKDRTDSDLDMPQTSSTENVNIFTHHRRLAPERTLEQLVAVGDTVTVTASAANTNKQFKVRSFAYDNMWGDGSKGSAIWSASAGYLGGDHAEGFATSVALDSNVNYVSYGDFVPFLKVDPAPSDDFLITEFYTEGTNGTYFTRTLEDVSTMTSETATLTLYDVPSIEGSTTAANNAASDCSSLSGTFQLIYDGEISPVMPVTSSANQVMEYLSQMNSLGHVPVVKKYAGGATPTVALGDAVEATAVNSDFVSWAFTFDPRLGDAKKLTFKFTDALQDEQRTSAIIGSAGGSNFLKNEIKSEDHATSGRKNRYVSNKIVMSYSSGSTFYDEIDLDHDGKSGIVDDNEADNYFHDELAMDVVPGTTLSVSSFEVHHMYMYQMKNEAALTSDVIEPIKGCKATAAENPHVVIEYDGAFTQAVSLCGAASTWATAASIADNIDDDISSLAGIAVAISVRDETNDVVGVTNVGTEIETMFNGHFPWAETHSGLARARVSFTLPMGAKGDTFKIHFQRGSATDAGVNRYHASATANNDEFKIFTHRERNNNGRTFTVTKAYENKVSDLISLSRIGAYIHGDGGSLAGVVSTTDGINVWSHASGCGTAVIGSLNPGTYHNVQTHVPASAYNSETLTSGLGAVLMVVVDSSGHVVEVQITSGGTNGYKKEDSLYFADKRMKSTMAPGETTSCHIKLGDMSTPKKSSMILKSIANGIDTSMECLGLTPGHTCTDPDLGTTCNVHATKVACDGATDASGGACVFATTGATTCTDPDGGSTCANFATDQASCVAQTDSGGSDACIFKGGCGIHGTDSATVRAFHHVTNTNGNTDGMVSGMRMTMECDALQQATKVTITAGGANALDNSAGTGVTVNTIAATKILAGSGIAAVEPKADCTNDYYYQFGFYSTGTPRFNRDLAQNNHNLGKTPKDEQITVYGMKNHMQYQYRGGTAKMATDSFFGLGREVFTDMNSGMGTFDAGYSITELGNDDTPQMTASVIAGENGAGAYDHTGSAPDPGTMMEHAEKGAYVGRGYDKLTVVPMPDSMSAQKVTITYTGPSASCSVTEVDRGTHESSECSGRGNCDYSTGTCLCDAGYTLEACSEQTVLV